ncbi:MAG: LysR family transcriptional regulator [Aquabacterium sp.]
MNLRNLRYFCSAYEAGSTVAAARLCHVTQPVISNAIAQLEEELGTQLFTRQQRGLTPTAEGVRLFRLGGKLLGDAQALVESFQDASSHPRLRLRVHPTVSVLHVQRLLRHLRQEISQLELSIHAAPQDEVDAELTSRTCVTAGRHFMPLWEEQYALLLPREHPLVLKPNIGLADLQGVAFIERTQCELAGHFHTGLAHLQVTPDVRARVDSQEWAIGLVAAGVGLTIAPLHPLDRHHEVVVRRDVAELKSVSRTVGLACDLRPSGVLASVLQACEPWARAAALTP